MVKVDPGITVTVSSSNMTEMPGNDEEDGRRTPFRLPKQKSYPDLIPKKPVNGIYVPRADDQDYYRVDYRDVASPMPLPSEASLDERPKKPQKVDKMAVFYKPSSGCLTHYFRSKRSAYVEHLMSKINLNTAKIIISEFPDLTGTSLPTRSKSAPSDMKMMTVAKDQQRSGTPRTARDEVKGRMAKVEPRPPPSVERQNTGLLGSPRRERPAVERSLPEMPNLKVKVSWKAPHNTPRVTSPDQPRENSQTALVPYKPPQERHDSDQIKAITEHGESSRSDPKSSGDLDRQLTKSFLGTGTIDATQRIVLYHPDQEIPQPQQVQENVLRKRQFKPMKSRDKLAPGWKNEELLLSKERPQTSLDSSSGFFKVNRPCRLHPREFGYCVAHKDLRRALTSQSFRANPQCIMCQCGIEWASRDNARQALPGII